MRFVWLLAVLLSVISDVYPGVDLQSFLGFGTDIKLSLLSGEQV